MPSQSGPERPPHQPGLRALVGVLLALVVAACGSPDISAPDVDIALEDAAQDREDGPADPDGDPDSEPDGETEQPGNDSTSGAGTDNPIDPIFRKILEGDCSAAAGEAASLLATADDEVVAAEAHLARGLALACLGQVELAEAELLEAQEDSALLSPSSQAIMDQLDARAPPEGHAEVSELLPAQP